MLPVIMELHQRSGIKCYIATVHKETYDSLMENIVIKDVMDKVGGIVHIGPHSNRLISKIQKIFFVINLCLKVLSKKVFLFHFGFLSKGIFSLIRKCSDKSRVFFCEMDSSAYSAEMFRIGYIKRNVFWDITKIPSPGNCNLLTFGDEWPWLHDKRSRHLPVYKIRHPRRRKVWREFVKMNSEKYLEHLEYKENVVSLMLGNFGQNNVTKDDETPELCLRETLEVLSKFKNVTVFVKKHPVTPLEKLEALLADFPTLDIQMVDIHPSILSTISNVFVCTYYTTSVYDAFLLGLPTVEYTEYHEPTLIAANYNSCRPEYVTHFIQRDKNKLKEIFAEYFNKKPELNFSPEEEEGEELFKFITGS
jgi:hypothetical protein